MSSFIYVGKTFMSFDQFMLSESVRPKKVQYGTNSDFNDSKIFGQGNVYSTSFMMDDKVYTIIIADNEVGFHFTYTKNINFDRFNYIIDCTENDSYLNLGASNAARIFGMVFYIILEIVNSKKLNKIIFEAEHDKLDKIYSNLVNNKYFIDEFSSLGFNFKKQGSKYIFSKE